MKSSLPVKCPSPVQAPSVRGYENLTVTSNTDFQGLGRTQVQSNSSQTSSFSPRVLRSRHGQRGVVVSLGSESPSFIRTVGRQYKIHKCTHKLCLTCPNLNTSTEVISNVTHRKYKIINHPLEDLNCHSQNLVYLLTCQGCNIQYVGETAYPFHKRLNQHRTSKCGCEHLIHHSNEVCKMHSFTYQILEKLPGTGYKNGKLDLDMLKARQKCADDWIKKDACHLPIWVE